MTFHRLLTSVLALAAAVVPASASAIYCSAVCGANDQTAFTSATAALFFPNASINFSTIGIVEPAESEYLDANSGVDFFSTTSNGTTLDFFSKPVVGAALKTSSFGDLIQVLLPAGVFAFSAHMVQSNPNSSFCVEAQSTWVTNGCNNPFFPGTGTEFIGVVSNLPITSVWIGANSGSPLTQLNDFEIGIAQQQADTPEIATFLMLGTGLISLRMLHRKVRQAV